MGTAYSARQSSYTQGDTINADDSNDEFDAILAAFGTSGHSHDGTAGEGGAIAKLLSNTLTFGAATSGTDITITFDGESNDGVLAWMEDEDYFKFSDDILINSTEKIMFGDSTSFIHQSSDGVLTIDGEATIDLNASTAVLVSNDLKLNSDAAVLGFGADNDVKEAHVADTGLLLNSTMALQFNDASQYINAPSATVLDINATDEVEVNATLMDVNANLDVSGTYTGGGLMTTGGNIVIPNAGNIGSASDTDAIAISSGGVVTMNQIPVFSAGINVSGGTIAGTLSTAAQGNITSLGTLTTLTVDNIIINGTTIGHTSDTDAMTISSGGVVTFSQTPVFSGDLTIGDDVYLDSDAAVIHFGDDGDVTLTHVADTGLLLNSTRQLQFGDSGTYIHQSADGVLDLVSDTEIEINATTIDINGAVDVSGAYTGGGLMTTGGNIVIPDAGNIGSASDTDAIAISSGGVVTMNQIPVFSAGINVSGGTIAGTLATAAQGNVTSLGTLTTLTVDNIIINGTTIGHTSDTDAMTISSGGVVTFSQTPVFSSDLTLGDDLYLDSDGAVIHFGDDGDVTLTHVADTGLLLNSTMALQFNDASQYINAPSATVLDINATDEVEVNATLMDVNANLDVSGTYTGGGLMTTGGNIVIPDAGNIGSASDTNAIAIGSDGDVTLTQDLELQHDGAILSFGANDDVKVKHIADTGLEMYQDTTADTGFTLTLSAQDTAIEINHVLGELQFKAGSESSGTDALQPAAGIAAIAEGDFTASSNATKLSFKTASSEAASEKMSLSSSGNLTLSGDATLGDDLYLDSDAAVIHFGDDGDVTLTHVHNAGLTLSGNLYLPDNKYLNIGTSNDLTLYHDGSDSHIKDQGTGDLYISAGDDLVLRSKQGAETALIANDDGSVELYHDNVKKFETTSGGVEVTGVMDADNFKVNGGQGSDGQVLTSTGSGVAWEDAGGGGGSWTLIGTQTADDSANLTQTGIDATYATYAIIIEDFHPASDNATLMIRLGDSNGIDSSGGEYDVIYDAGVENSSAGSGNSRTYTFEHADSGIKTASFIGAATGEGVAVVAYLHNARGSGMYPTVTGRGYVINQNGNGETIEFWGHRTSMITTDRILAEFEGSTNIESGRMTVWGIAHA
jgi:phage gp45-like